MAEKRMVFAIGRRCGSGGREIGKKLADHYGIKFYDKEIVTMLAERMNMPEEEIAKLVLSQNDLKDACESRRQESLGRGAPDNVTAVLISI